MVVYSTTANFPSPSVSRTELNRVVLWPRHFSIVCALILWYEFRQLDLGVYLEVRFDGVSPTFKSFRRAKNYLVPRVGFKTAYNVFSAGQRLKHVLNMSKRVKTAGNCRKRTKYYECLKVMLSILL